MKKIFTILVPIAPMFIGILLSASVFAQAPQKMSYQAVIRDASINLITSHAVGMRISILQGTTPVYVETQTTSTNANGLVSVEIGNGTFVSGVVFSAIDWSTGTYFIKTETDPAGGTNYTAIVGTSQLLSVPYALNAKTAESITGTITETDPIYTSSQAANITANDITKVSNLSGINTGDQDLTGLATTSAVTTGLATKVDKVTGKGLSTNDYTTAEQTKLAAITGDQDLSGLATTSAVNTALNLKVDKEAGKGLSTNDYTTAEQAKVAAITGINTGDQDITGLATTTSVTTGLATKVDKEAGKGLSTNDYTTVEQTKVSNLSGTNTGDQTLSSLGAVASNTVITAGTNTKITYDAKGLVTAGAAATTADIATSTDKKYVTDAQQTVISNTSGTNTGDNATNTQYSGLDAAKANLSGATFTGAISATNLSGSNTGDQTLPTLVSLGAVASNAAITAGTNTKITYDAKGLVTAGAAATTADIAASTNKNYVTDAQQTVIGNTSSTNTGDNATNTQYSGLVTNATHTGDVTGTVALTIANNAVTDAKFRQGAARSIVGVTGNATANTADIQGAADQILRVNGAGTVLAFGSVDLSKSAAIGTSILPVANGGMGVDVTPAGAGEVLYSSSTTAYGHLVAGTSGQVLTSAGAGAPTWQSTGATAWSLLGNTGTIDGTNFIGTTDDVPFNVKVNGEKAGRIDNTLYNTFWGYQAGNSITTGTNNTANGASSLYSNTTANQNIAIGSSALYTQSFNNGDVSWNSDNVAVGYSALYFNQPTSTTDGIQNTAIGNFSLYSNTTGYNNTSIGESALYTNTVGFNNTVLGWHAAYNLNSNNNTIIGKEAGYYLTTQQGNTFLGVTAGGAVGEFGIAGDRNTYLGFSAGQHQYGKRNTIIGYQAFQGTSGLGNDLINTGDYSVALGYFALKGNGTGGNNTAIGSFALQTNTTGSNNTAIGYDADVSDGLSNATAIGYNALVEADNSLVLGDATDPDLKVGIGTTQPGARLEVDVDPSLSPAPAIKIVDGNEGTPGYVLTNVDGDGLGSWQAPAVSIDGSGNPGYISKFTTDGTTLGSSSILDDGTNVSFSGLSTDGIVRTSGGTGTISSSGGEISLTSEVTGTLPIANGGMGADVTPAGAGEVLYSSSTTAYDHLGAGTTGQVLTSNGAAAPIWTTPNSGWSLTGNTAAIDGSNFIGTTNDMPFNVKVNGENAGRIDNQGSTNNTFWGYQAGNSTTGIYNTAMGFQALYYNETGSSNTANGITALLNNKTGSSNTANGQQALYSNTTGSNNTAIGYGALYSNTIGDNNTAIGYGAGVSSGNLTNATAIGYGAIVTASDNVQIGNSSVTDVYFGNGTTTVLHGKINVDGSDTKVTAGTNITVTGTGTSGSPYVISAPAHAIGDSYQGGIIFWLDATGQHGLIAATIDQTFTPWSNGTSRYTGTTGDGLYAGAMNTAMIVATQIADNQTGNFAAKVCADYSVTDGGVTYGDWYLPSEYELSLLYLQGAWFSNFPGGFWYWSSTESSDTQARIVNLESGGGQSLGSKNLEASVRAIRAF